MGLVIVVAPRFTHPRMWVPLETGGAIFTNDDALVEKLRMIAAHGQSKRYYHDVIGCNSRLDAVQAAILDIKLRHLDEYIAARRKAADYYDQAFLNHEKIEIPFRSPDCKHVFHQYTLTLKSDPADERRAFQDAQNCCVNLSFNLVILGFCINHLQRPHMFAFWIAKIGVQLLEPSLTNHLIYWPKH